MKRIILLPIVFVLIFSTQSCNDFDEINTDPNNPAEVSPSLLLADILFNGLNRMYSTFNGTDMGSCWAQHVAKVQYNDEALYVPRETALENMWTTLYEDVASDARTMSNLAAEEGNANVQAVGLVLQAWAFATLADCFGNVPFSEALQADEGNFLPAYDEEETVYAGVLQLLDEANSLFGPGAGDINSVSDIMYGGDWAKWQKFCNSLKFRILMRIADKDGETDIDVAAQLSDVFNNREWMTSNDDEASIAYLNSDPNANPIWETINFDGRGEFRMCETLIEKLMDLNDPRLPIYAQPLEDGVTYRGKPAGIIEVPNDDYNYDNVSQIGLFWTGDMDEVPEGWGPSAPGVILSYSQFLFLVAEAAERGFISADAKGLYEAAVLASMERLGVAFADAQDYLDQTAVDYDQAINKRQLIAEQVWLALFNQGIEAWTEQRRTGFPVLQPALESTLGQIPSRYTYPNIEASINPSNFTAAGSAIGGDELDTPVWWME